MGELGKSCYAIDINSYKLVYSSLFYIILNTMNVEVIARSNAFVFEVGDGSFGMYPLK